MINNTSDKKYVIILSDNYLYRYGIEKIISNSNGEGRFIFSSMNFDDLNKQDIDQIDQDPEASVLVLLSSSGDDPNSIQIISTIKSRFPGSGVIILSYNSNPNHLYQCISNGADGYLLSYATEDTLLDTMRLVRNGQSVFPSQIGNLMDNPRSGEKSSRDTEIDAGIIDARSFSDREIQVLGCLALGMSNKAISRALEVADATVKLTVRNMLGKINVKNRVQAAVWATKNGFSYVEPSHSQQAASIEISQRHAQVL